METETYDNAADFMRALRGQQRAQRATRPRSARTGLSTLIALGWNVEWDSAMRLRLWRGESDTGYFDDEKAACDAAKELTNARPHL